MPQQIALKSAAASGFVAATLCLAASTTHAQNAPDLISAVRRSDVAAVRALAVRSSVSVKQADGTTALHWATNLDNVEIVDLLLAHGASPDAATDFGVTPLSLAATNGSARIIERLLKAGANPNLALPTGETPLMTAARTGDVGSVAALLSYHADPNAKETGLGQTALMWAVAEGHAGAVAQLLEHGASVEAASSSGFTALMFAARDGNIGIARTLLSSGAPIDAASVSGDTALSVGVVRGQVDLAEFLLDQHANPNIDKAGYTPLHWAVAKWETGMTHDYAEAQGEWATLGGIPAPRKLELIKALLHHGADPNARARKSPPRFGVYLFTPGNLSGATPFYFAAMSADVDVLRLLVANGADPLLTVADGTTALMMACGQGRTEGESVISDEQSRLAAEYMVTLGVGDINAANKQGDTALHSAATQGLDETIRFLVSKGGDLRLKNKKDETPLKIAEGVTLLAQLIEHPRTAAVIRSLGGTK